MSDKQVERAGSTVKVRPTVARHGRQRRSRAWRAVLGTVGGGLAVVLVAGASVAGIAAWQLSSDIDVETIGSDSIALPPMVGKYEGGFTIFLTGSDTREGQGGLGGSDNSGTLNDVNMLLSVSDDQQSATLVSFPRDLVVPLPACQNGGPAAGQPLNVTLSYGGLDCTVKTIENLTGMSVDFAGLITFRGVVNMSNAVGGVEVCTAGPIIDRDAGLRITSAGTHTLSGREALAFLRSRKGVGDGSDLGRISSQQVYLSSLVRKLKSDETLGDPATVYALAQAATKNMTLSRNFSRLDVLASLALALKDIPLENIAMVQYPSRTGVTSPAYYAGKVAPIPAQADALFDAIKSGRPIQLDGAALDNRNSVTENPDAPTESPEPDSTAGPTTTPSPSSTVKPVTVSGVKGQTADTYTCSVPY